MEEINERLTKKQKEFFKNLSMYIDRPIHFYGSIFRSDYIVGKSDIDIDIFTDNESSTIQFLCNFLNLKKSDFKRCVYKIKTNVINGYKGNYKDEENGIDVEISIYNYRYRNLVTEEHDVSKSLPFYLTFILFIIKNLYYRLNILSKKAYKRCKRFIMNDNDEIKFIEVDN